MGDQNKRQVEFFQYVFQPRFRFLIKPAGRFVEKQDFRFHGQNSGQSHQSFFSRGQFKRDAMFKALQSEVIQRPFRNFKGFFLGLAHVQRTECDIFLHRGTKQLVVGILKQKSNSMSYFRVVFFCADTIAEKLNLAGSWFYQPHDEMKQSGFSTTVGSNQAQSFTGIKFKIEVAQDCISSRITEGNPLQVYDRCCFSH